MAYNGTIELISGIKPQNNGNFPMVDAKDVYIDDDTRLNQILGKVVLTTAQNLTQSQKQIARNNIGAGEVDNTLTQQGMAADAKKTGDQINALKDDLCLLEDEIPDTTQTYTFSDGSVSQVTHSRNETAIRTDVFTYGESTITEVRTLNTGESLTIVTNLTTLETSVTYSAV